MRAWRRLLVRSEPLPVRRQGRRHPAQQRDGERPARAEGEGESDVSALTPRPAMLDK